MIQVYNKNFMVDTTKDRDLFWIDNYFIYDRYNMTPLRKKIQHDTGNQSMSNLSRSLTIPFMSRLVSDL
jgi:hypothetical protein